MVFMEGKNFFIRGVDRFLEMPTYKAEKSRLWYSNAARENPSKIHHLYNVRPKIAKLVYNSNNYGLWHL